LKRGVTIRPYGPGDEEGIVRLFNQCFGEGLDMAKWRWRFRHNPAGQPAIVVAESGGEIVGHCSYQPARFMVDGVSKIGAQHCHLMVRSDHRGGRGPERLSYRLLCTLRSMAFGFGYDFIFYAPNRFSLWMADHPVTGAPKVMDLPQMVKPLNPLYLVRRPPGTGLLRLGRRLWSPGFLLRRPAGVHEAEGFDGRFDRLWRLVNEGYRMIMIRDSDYLRWRFMSPAGGPGEGLRLHPYRLHVREGEGGLLGYAMVRVREEGGWRIGYLVDMLARSDDTSTLRLLAKAALSDCRRDEADAVRCWMPGPYRARAVLRDLGFLPRPLAVGWRARLVTPEGRPDAPIDATGWYLTLGDGDGI